MPPSSSPANTHVRSCCAELHRARTHEHAVKNDVKQRTADELSMLDAGNHVATLGEQHAASYFTEV